MEKSAGDRKSSDQFLGSGLSRRTFMQTALAAGMSLYASDQLWAQQVASTPRKGGTLRLVCDGGGATDTMEGKASSGADHITCVQSSVYDTLVFPTAEGSVQSNLAESWSSSSDGRTWEFKLKKGVEFHNGKSLTASDVVWSLSQHAVPGAKNGDGRNIVGNFESIRADDSNTVIIVQKEANRDLPIQLSAYALLVAPEGTANWNEPGRGTGPYMIESFEPGVRFIGKKFQNFHREDQGWFDSVDVGCVLESATRTNALMTGAADVIGNPEPKTAKRLSKVGGKVLEVVPSGQHFLTAMRCDADPFTNEDLRLAIKYGIKRQEIVDKVLYGYGYVGNDHPIGKNYQYYNPDLEQREFDPEKARFHAKKSGYGGGVLELKVSDGIVSGSVAYGQLMQATLRDVGINVEVKTVPADGYFSNVWLKTPWCASYQNPRPTADWILTNGYSSKSPFNDSGFNSPALDKLLSSARGEADDQKRRQMYYEAQRIVRDGAGNTVLAFANFLIGSTDRMGHGPIGAQRRLDDARLTRKWWFKT
ncbi:ABC transporter substrate-binding protein [Mesorhizobium sp. Root102]|uniref:ABC transporter substrate-binding protein n=1 Tax=Mesorhizobium sp. Root102 TaxID=1736422 RepID=UPI0012E3B15D|nr:ABC transporter substrate-binding protein [Mesorhizobium sp. Root102]